jgi:hypothetical protein
MTRWIVSAAAGIAVLPATYVANFLIRESSSIASLLAAGNALTLIP